MPSDSLPPPPTTPPASPPPCETEVHRSVEGRTLVRWIYGKGEQTILVLAGIRGDETAGYELARRLAGHLEAHPETIRNRRVVIVPVLNPDGLERKTPRNANDVDLNRDFPRKSNDVDFDRDFLDKIQPETVALLKWIECHRPRWIISLRNFQKFDFDPAPSSEDWEQYIAGEGARAIARTMAKYMSDLPVGRIGSHQGSLGHYAGNILKIPLVSMGLHRDADRLSPEALWARYGEALLTGVTHRLGARSKKPEDWKNPQVKRFEMRYREGISRFERQQYREAIRIFSELNTEWAQCPDCAEWIRKSRSALNRVKIDEPKEPDGEGGTEKPEIPGKPIAPNWDEVRKEALSLFGSGRYDEAIEKWRALRKMEGGCGDCADLIAKAGAARDFRAEGERLFDQGDYESAAERFESVLEIQPQDSVAKELRLESLRRAAMESLERGRRLCAENRWDEGISAVNDALKRDPGCGPCGEEIETCRRARDAHFYDSGKRKFREEDIDGAIDDWSRVRPSHGNVADRLRQACELLRRLGRANPGCGS
jgi:tetratricopeptide (TPR) repeat protein